MQYERGKGRSEKHKVYKFNNTKEGWHEFALKFRVIADHRGYDDIIEGNETAPDEKEDLEITDKDDAAVTKSKKDRQKTRATNKKFRQVDERRPKEGMGETKEMLEPQDKRRQRSILH